MQCFVSIAVCTYNGAPFLTQQLDSILAQSHQNIEVIIVDDCSTDATSDILETYAALHKKIKVYKNEMNLGFNKNFEKAISLCAGDYIAISDQDDIWEPYKLELLLKHIGNCWLIFSNSIFINKRNEIINGQILSDNFQLNNRTYKSLLFVNFVTGHTTLFRRDFVNLVKPIPKTGYYDWWMGFVALYHQKIACLNKKLTRHRIHADSVMYKYEKTNKFNNRRERYKEIIENLQAIKNYANLRPADRNFLSKLYAAYCKSTFLSCLYMLGFFYKNYADIFPDLKKRTGISKLNYARKIAFKKYRL